MVKEIKNKKSRQKLVPRSGISLRETTRRAQKVEEDTETKKSSRAGFLRRFSKKNLILVVSVFGVFALLFYFKSIFIAAVVNGQPITRLSVIKTLEKQGGKQALNTLVTKTLIIQEARKRNISITQKEIDEELDKIEKNVEKQGQKLDQLLALQGIKRNELKEQIEVQKLLEKMVGKDIKISDKEINEFLENNKESIPAGMKEEEVKNNAREQLRQQKLGEKVQLFIEETQKKAKINYLVQY